MGSNTKFHNTHTLSVQDCQEMIMTGDVLMICRGKKPLFKNGVVKAHAKFIEELQGLFGGDKDLIDAIGKDSLIMRLRVKRDMLTGLKDSLTWCYSVKSNVKGQIKAFSQTKDLYRQIYSDYPKSIEEGISDDQFKEEVANILNPIESEIKRLGYKIKELSPPVEKEAKEDEDGRNSVGLELHILFTQQVLEIYIPRQHMSVHSFHIEYKEAVKKNSKQNAKS